MSLSTCYNGSVNSKLYGLFIMQIREKGQKVLCIRTEYVPEKKRTYGRTVASQESFLSTVSEEVCQQLTDEEVDQLEKWLFERDESKRLDRLSTGLSTIAYRMDNAAKALEVDSIRDGLSTEQVDKIWLAHERLSKSLRRHKFAKPKKPAKPRPQPVNNNQQGLPLDESAPDQL